MEDDGRGWVFVSEETEDEIGFAEEHECENAEEAMHWFGQEASEDFLVFFRDSHGVVEPTTPDSTPEDFE